MPKVPRGVLTRRAPLQRLISLPEGGVANSRLTVSVRWRGSIAIASSAGCARPRGSACPALRKGAQELRILISALLDRFPGKELVVPRSDTADRKLAVLVRRRGLIERSCLRRSDSGTRITVAPLKGLSSFSTRPLMRPPFGLTSTSSDPGGCFRLTFRPGSSTS